MTRELIISANVHEKKVAILEDGVVTEFYVERRDENQGVVGNLYKGRVMKVLPGMQSAFVDIGLERDAFLYVSDFTEFMEEEEEIDFREAAEQPRAARLDERAKRRERPGRAVVSEAAQTEVARATDRQPPETTVEIEDVVEQLAEIADESVIPPPPAEEEIEEYGSVGAAPLDGTVTEAEVTAVEDWTQTEPGEEEPAAAAEEVALKPRRGRSRKRTDEEGARTGRRAKTEGETAKRRGRAAKRPQVEDEGVEEVGTAVAAREEAQGGPQFERITDEEFEQEAGELLKDAMLQEKIIEQVHTAEYETTPPRREPEPEWRVGSYRSQLEEPAGFQRVIDEEAESRQVLEQPDEGTLEGDQFAGAESAGEPEEPPVSPFRHISHWISSRFYERARTEPPVEPVEAQPEAEAASAPAQDASEKDDEDREASIRDRGHTAEFAVRRGGRGRRRRREPQSGSAVSEETSVAAPEVAEKPEAEPNEVQAAAEVPSPVPPRPPRRQEGRFDRRPEASRRPEYAPRPRPDRAVPATISELLHEGQEILVQIAKEPIAKKGARITSHIALPGRYLVYMPTVNHIGVSRKIASEVERVRLKRTVIALRDREGATGGFIARTACAGHSEQELHDDMRYLLRTWADVRKKADRVKSPALVHRDLDLVQRILRDQLSEEFSAIRVDNEIEYARIVEFVNRVQPKLVKRVKLYVGNQPILEKYAVQPEIDKAVKPRVWLRSGGYIVINQTEALVAIDVNTGKFVGKSDRLEDTITRTNLEAAKEIVRQVRLRDLGGIIVIDFIDMEERKNRQKVMAALQQELQTDRAPSKILSINDFGLVAITRKRVKQSLERTLCTPCPYCQGAGMVKSAQTMCFEILEQAKAFSRQAAGSNDVLLRVSPDVAEALHSSESEVLAEIEAYFASPITIESDPHLHQEQFDFAIV